MVVKGSRKIQINKPTLNIFVDKLTKASVEHFMVNPFIKIAPKNPALWTGMKGASAESR